MEFELVDPAQVTGERNWAAQGECNGRLRVSLYEDDDGVNLVLLDEDDNIQEYLISINERGYKIYAFNEDRDPEVYGIPLSKSPGARDVAGMMCLPVVWGEGGLVVGR